MLRNCVKSAVALGIMLALVSSFVWQKVDAAKQKTSSASCTIDVTYTMQAQDGTVLSVQNYSKAFVVTEGVPFIDDFSTATRFKEFSASLTQVAGEQIVSINFFEDVSVFDSIDFSTSLTLVKGQKQGSISADHTFSSTPGHGTTSYVLTAARN